MLVFMLGEIPPNNILIINFISTVVATISEVFGMCVWNRRVAKFQNDRLELKQQYLESCGVSGDLRPNP